MILDKRGIGVYRVLSIIFILALIFVLALPSFFDMHKKEKAETCVRNMKEVKSAVERYMYDRDEVFTGNTDDLKRTRYIEGAIDECPQGRVGDKYHLSVDRETRDVKVRCQNVGEYHDHVL